MASRHHNHSCLRHQNHHFNIPQVATSPHCCTQSPPPEDNLLHLVASYLQNHQHETQCSCEASCQRFIRSHHQQKNVPKPREYDSIVLSCLLRKIDDLEASLEKFSSFYDQRRDRHSKLKDSAARVIQTHFRSYLVHRSISFRQLKELAMIKSSFLSLKSSVSGKPIFDFKVVSRKVTDLLLQLDSIQGRIDPMIRSSKRTLSRDLVRFLQYVDDCVVKRYGFVAKSAITVSSRSKLNGKKPQGVAEDRTIEKSRNRVRKVVGTSTEDEDNNADMTDDSEEVPMSSIDKRKIGSSKSRTGTVIKGDVVKPPVSKFIVLDKNRNVCQVFGNNHDLSSSGEDDSVDSDEETLVMSRDNGKRQSLKTGNRVLVKGSGKTTRVVKTVSFDENGNVCKVYGDTHDVTSSVEDDSVDSDEETLVMSRDNGKRHSSKTGNGFLVKGSGGKTHRVVKTVSFDENGNVCKVYGDTRDVTSSAEDDSVDSSEETLVMSRDNGRRNSSKTRNEVLVKGSGGKTTRVVKTVSFDENGNVCKVYGDTHDVTSSVEDDSVDSDEETLVMSRDNGKRHSSKTGNGFLVKGSGGKTHRVVKTVSFDENGNVCKVYGDTRDVTSSAEDDSVDSSEETLVMSRDNGRRNSSKTRNEVLVKGSGGKTTRVVKTVSFDENGNVYKVYGDTPESSISEEDDSTSGSNDGNGEEKRNGNEVEEIKDVPKENESFEEDEEEETHSENEDSSTEGSEGDAILTRNVNHPGSNEHKKDVQLQKGCSMFSPPLPLKMEP